MTVKVVQAERKGKCQHPANRSQLRKGGVCNKEIFIGNFKILEA